MNRAIRIVAVVMSIMLAIGGMDHGYFETQQGNTPTGGLVIDAIGEAQRAWVYGGETAFSLIPNFLVTGLAAITVSIVIIVWAVGFVQTKHGATGLLLLLILLFLVGGGIGHIVFFPFTWAYATRINKPLTWWRTALPEGSARRMISKIWPWAMVIAFVLFLLTIEIAVFGYFPGVEDPEQLMTIVFSSLGLSLVFYLLAFISAVAHDIEEQAESRLRPAMSG